MKLGTHMDCGLMDCVYWKQAAMHVCPFVSSFFFFSSFPLLTNDSALLKWCSTSAVYRGYSQILRQQRSILLSLMACHD